MKRRKFVFGRRNIGASVASRWQTPERQHSRRRLGVNSRGMSHVGSLIKQKNATLAVLVDPDKKVLAKRQEEIEKKHNIKVEIESDLRKVFDRKDIDVVTIATPNHWHALATIWACQAGKDVYVEKPGSHNVFEGRAMVEAAKRYKRMVQHGVQLRSSPAVREAVEHLRKGTIGDVYMARACAPQSYLTKRNPKRRPRPSIGTCGGAGPGTRILETLRPYNWHWHWDYSSSDVGNQRHQTDMCLWGLALPPDAAMGGRSC